MVRLRLTSHNRHRFAQTWAHKGPTQVTPQSVRGNTSITHRHIRAPAWKAVARLLIEAPTNDPWDPPKPSDGGLHTRQQGSIEAVLLSVPTSDR